jgi:tetratricopeptide (TPR) repeat protein
MSLDLQSVTNDRRGFWFATGLVVALVLTAAGSGYAQQLGASSAAEKQFIFAYRLLERQSYELAAEAFDQYLGDFPRDDKRGDGCYYRAYLAHKAGADRDALRFLEAAPPTRLVKDSAVLLLKAEVHSQLGRHDQAIGALESIQVDTLEPALQAQVLYLRGQTYRVLKNLPAAAGQLQRVVAMDSPWRAAALLDLARVQALMGRHDEALELLDRCLKKANTDTAPEAARLAGDLALEQRQYEQALKYYQIVMTRYTSSKHLAPAMLGVLWSHLRAKQYDRLLVLFERYKSHAALDLQQRVEAYYLAGSAQQALAEHAKAVALYGRALGAASGSKIEDKLLYKLAVSQFELGQYAPMRQTLAKLLRGLPNSPYIPDAKFLSAIAAARQQGIDQGTALLQAIVDAGPKHAYYPQALLQMAQLAQRGGRLKSAEQHYTAYLAFARSASGVKRVAEDDQIAATLQLIHVHHRAGHYVAAESRAAELLKRPGLDPIAEAAATYRRARAAIQLEHYQAADDWLAELNQRHPRNRFAAEALYYRGLLALTLNRPDDALTLLTQAAATPRLPQKLKITVLRTVALQWRSKAQVQQAADTLGQLEQLVGTKQLQDDEQLWLARYHADRAKPQKALTYLLPLVEKMDQLSGTVGAEAMLLTAVALRDLGDHEQALKLLQEVMARGNADAGLRARLESARILTAMDRTQDALSEYDELLRAEVVDVQAHALFESAVLYRTVARKRARQGTEAGADEARRTARDRFLKIVLLFAGERFSPLPQLAHINLAEIAQAEGRHADATAAFEELKAKHADGLFAAYAKAMLQLQAKHKNEARFLLQKLVDQKLERRLAQRVAAALKTLGTL